jgi:TPR repeat protein
LLARLLAATLLALSGSASADDVPATMRQCEGNLCESGGGGTWTFNGRTGKARWTIGVQADLTVERYDNGEVIIRRVDDPTGSTRGATAIYKGTVKGNRIEGSVDYNWPGHFDHGRLTRPWYALIGEWAPGLEPARPVAAHPNLKPESQEQPLALPPLPALPAKAIAETVRRADQFLAAQNHGAAAPLYRQAAEAGNPHAQDRLGVLFLTGSGVPKHCGEALKWLHKADDAGDPDAPRDLGGIHSNGYCVAKDLRAALQWLLKAADRGNSDAMNSIGRIALYGWSGDSIDQNIPQAMNWFHSAADRGNGEAARNLATYYLRAMPPDYGQAKVWLAKAIALGDGAAMTLLAGLHERGEGVPRDLRQAYELYQLAAALGDEDAKSHVYSFSAVGYSAGDTSVGGSDTGGTVLFDLSGVWDGYYESAGTPWAFRIYQAGDRIAAERLNVDTLAAVGQRGFKGSYDSPSRTGPIEVPIYDFNTRMLASMTGTKIEPKGWTRETLTIVDPDHIKIGNRPVFQRVVKPQAFDVPCDPDNAFRVQANYASLRGWDAVGNGANARATCWFRIAANQGHAHAMSELGRRLHFGIGVDRNDTEAFDWLKRGAERGDAYGSEILALLYEQGDGVAADKAQAEAWHARTKAIKAKEQRDAKAEKIRQAKEELETQILINMGRAALRDSLGQMLRDPRCDGVDSTSPSGRDRAIRDRNEAFAAGACQ